MSIPVTVNAPHDIIDDLCTRFMGSIPEELRDDDVRVFFEIEMAHWFYLDNYCDNPDFPQCKPMKFRTFCHQVYDRCKYLTARKDNVDQYLEEFQSYKQIIPTNGAILIDSSLEYVLLVRGYQNNASWGFPKGKVNEAEPAVNCAIREVEEEVGYDISDIIDEKISVSRYINKAVTQLFVVTDIPLDAKFKPNVNKEIGKIQWFRLDCLPRDKNDEECFRKIGLRANKFFNVSIFIAEIQRHVQKLKAKRKKQAKSPKKPVTVPTVSFTGQSFLQMFQNHAASTPNMDAFVDPGEKSDKPYTICVFTDEKAKALPSAPSTPNILQSSISSPRPSSSNVSNSTTTYLRHAASASASLSAQSPRPTLQRKASDIPEDPHVVTLSEKEQLLEQATEAMRRFFNIKPKPNSTLTRGQSPPTPATMLSDSLFEKLFPNLSHSSHTVSSTSTSSPKQRSRSPPRNGRGRRSDVQKAKPQQPVFF